MKLVQGYKCEYCHRVFGRPVDAHNHEICCPDNPKSKRCMTCKHCSLELGRTIAPPFCGAEEYQTTEPTCLLNNITVHEKCYEEECETVDLYEGDYRSLPGTCFNYDYKGYAKYEKREAEEECISQEAAI